MSEDENLFDIMIDDKTNAVTLINEERDHFISDIREFLSPIIFDYVDECNLDKQTAERWEKTDNLDASLIT